ncbi:DUF368 domain-containing protein [Reinekea thalattae]|uniref:DUF368 domain-containing protein n=1 Tax=Reinekea thalattae TaxID=2593301 RepID=A0A5C8Z9V0_9GAMM|nr:DUF368 domain-containing protein [Reinekea thalattae]TXR54059.1 DUF368 domain-containing protein [Reinekea thalattae]
MGAADAVPGVSGGTIALITGVYRRFIEALASFKPDLLNLLLTRQWAKLWQRIDGNFLFSLGAGILLSLLSVLHAMHWLLERAAPLLWAFFMGVILISLVHLARQQTWNAKRLALFALGFAGSLGLVFLAAIDLAATPLMLVLGGALAISAMLLPGVSGSFILVLLGLYPQIVEAIHDRDIQVIAWVALGCLIGVLSFSQFLKWLMNNWYSPVLCCMLGVIAGALLKVWPWQANEQWFLPSTYATYTGQNEWLFASVVSFFIGVLLSGLLFSYSTKSESQG